MPTIKLRCPTCGLEKMDAPRGEDDPPEAALMVVECPKCVAGGFEFPEFFDANGRKIEPWFADFDLRP